MAYRIAYGAGHNDKTGNGIPEYLHKPFMNEWRLNDRVARYFAEAAALYEDAEHKSVELLRVDDPTAVVDLAKRAQAANDWGADFFLSIHHDAGIKGGTGGGMTVYCYPDSEEGRKYQDAVYTACMAAGGLTGRSSPKLEKAWKVLRLTTMPALLMEYGFMDSTADMPVILSEEYAKAMAYATMEGIAKVAGLQKKTQQEQIEEPEQKPVYRFQLGAFSSKEAAENMRQDLLQSARKLVDALENGFIAEGVIDK